MRLFRLIKSFRRVFSMNFFKILSIISLISSWMSKALEDGKITLREALELIGLLAPALGLPLDFEIADVLGGPEPESQAAITLGDDAAEKEVDPGTGRP
jgi:hypothetical protein